MSALCDKFVSFTGDCVTCKDYGYIVTNGKCVPPVVKCGPRQYVFNFTCVNASDLCKTIDDQGACTSCYDGFKVTNGTCTVIPVVCKEGQYVKENKCKDIPAHCPFFDQKKEACQICDRGYYVNNGVCLKIECPPR